MELTLKFEFINRNNIRFEYDFAEGEIYMVVENKDDEKEEPKHIESFDYQEVLAIRNFCNSFLEENKP